MRLIFKDKIYIYILHTQYTYNYKAFLIIALSSDWMHKNNVINLWERPSTDLESVQFILCEMHVFARGGRRRRLAFRRKVGAPQEGAYIALQDVPQHLREEWVPEFLRHLQLKK